MERKQIVCIFCGGKANIDQRDNLKFVTCPMCKRETEFDRYQKLFEQWIGEIRKET